MKIALIYDCLYPYSKGGGERRYYEIARNMSKIHEIHLIGMKYWSGNDIIQRDGIYYHGVCKAKEIYIKNRRSIWQPIYFAIKLTPYLFKEKFTIIDCSAFPYFSIFPVWLYSKIKKIPLTITWHEYWGIYWFKYLGVFGIFGWFVEKLATLISSNLIVVSRFTLTKLLKSGVRKERITLIENGIDIAKIKKASQNAEQSDLIFAGRLIKEKNIDILIKTVNEINKTFTKIKCYIIGEGPEKRNLELLTNDLGLNNNVRFLGFLEEENLYNFFKSSKIFTLLSEREGFGIVAVEANACGLPVITINTRDNAAKDLIKNNHNGFVCELNIQTIANQIKDILAHPRLLETLKNNSKKASEIYNWNIIANKSLNYYSNILL